MRTFLTWLLVIGFIAGLGTRVLATYSQEPCSHVHHDCSGHDHDAPGHDQGQDDQCPLDHHHHHCSGCLHTTPLGLENDLFRRLTVPDFTRTIVRHESERPPDGPFQALDKPPLI